MAIFTFALGMMLGGVFGFLVMAILSAGSDKE
jgi:hypothetical protein